MQDDKRAKREADLAAARASYEANPADEALAIWVGRRLSYLGRYDEAVAHYTEMIGRFGSTPRLLRHRGHRYITLRQFDRAIEDLSLAQILAAALPTEIEPDGIVFPAGPRATLQGELFYRAPGTPARAPGVEARTTLQGNILYHLALAHFVAGDPAAASRWWQRAVDSAENGDSLVSATYWLAIALFEQGRAHDAVAALARIRADGMDVRENGTYHRLCLALKGELPIEALSAEDGPLGIGVDRATLGFGTAMYQRHTRHDEAAACAALAATAALPDRASFGVIAAESLVRPRLRAD